MTHGRDHLIVFGRKLNSLNPQPAALHTESYLDSHSRNYNTLVDRASEELDSFFGNSYNELQLIATWLTCRKGLTMLSPGEKF